MIPPPKDIGNIENNTPLLKSKGVSTVGFFSAIYDANYLRFYVKICRPGRSEAKADLFLKIFLDRIDNQVVIILLKKNRESEYKARDKGKCLSLFYLLSQTRNGDASNNANVFNNKWERSTVCCILIFADQIFLLQSLVLTGAVTTHVETRVSESHDSFAL